MNAVMAGTCDWIDKHYDGVFRLAVRQLGNADDAADVTQECFLKALRSRDHFRGESTLKTWLTRIAINACRDHLRRRKRLSEFFVDVELNEDIDLAAQPSTDPLTTDVKRCLAFLDEDQQKALTLKYVDGLSFAELADAMGCSKRAALAFVRQAQRRLRRLLGGDCV